MQQIADWLKKLGMSEYAERFVENRIDLSVLPDLNQDVEKLGVLLGDRRKMADRPATAAAHLPPQLSTGSALHALGATAPGQLSVVGLSARRSASRLVSACATTYNLPPTTAADRIADLELVLVELSQTSGSPSNVANANVLASRVRWAARRALEHGTRRVDPTDDKINEAFKRATRC